MPATLRTLLASDAFRLQPIVSVGAAQLDRPIAWAHSSDLGDPTPWLQAGQLLLTNGSQFDRYDDPAKLRDYCVRLRERELAGLGFATDVVHEDVPPALVAAAEEIGLPLIEVRDRTPFIGIIRHIADVAAAERSSRLSWSLEAQRAVARAAVREDGLREILRTLSHRLHSWVALYDAAGGRTHVSGLDGIPDELAAHVAEESRTLLVKGAPASLRTRPPVSATLHTIGQSKRLRGVLAVGGDAPLDPAENDLVASVVALASIALEQQRALGASRRRIRIGILEMLRGGQLREADRTARAVWGALPEPPLLIAAMVGSAPGQSLLDELELMAGNLGCCVFFAECGSDVVILFAERARGDVAALAARHSMAAGMSAVRRWRDLNDGISEAFHAAATALKSELVDYADVVGSGVLGALRAAGGEVLAHTMLAPLDALPSAERDRLRCSARAWLAANAAWDPASRALGIHRHTLRARMDHLGELLGLDLNTFAGRAELWAAMELSTEPGRRVADATGAA